MKKTNYIGIVFIILGIYLIRSGISFPSIIPNVPGSGFFPCILGGGLIFLSILLLINERKNKESNIVFNNYRTYILMFISIIYVIVLNRLGFIITTIPFLSLLIWVFGYKNIKINLLGSVMITLIIYCAFSILLNVPLPEFNL